MTLAASTDTSEITVVLEQGLNAFSFESFRFECIPEWVIAPEKNTTAILYAANHQVGDRISFRSDFIGRLRHYLRSRFPG